MFLREGLPRQVKILPYKYELAVNLTSKPYKNLINKIVMIVVRLSDFRAFIQIAALGIIIIVNGFTFIRRRCVGRFQRFFRAVDEYLKNKNNIPRAGWGCRGAVTAPLLIFNEAKLFWL